MYVQMSLLINLKNAKIGKINSDSDSQCKLDLKIRLYCRLRIRMLLVMTVFIDGLRNVR